MRGCVRFSLQQIKNIFLYLKAEYTAVKNRPK